MLIFAPDAGHHLFDKQIEHCWRDYWRVVVAEHVCPNLHLRVDLVL